MILALDLSKKRTGWAWWDGKSDRPRYGSWKLGSEFTPRGGVFKKLHLEMLNLYKVMRFEVVYQEAPIHPAQLQGGTNIESVRLASGLAAHVESFCEAGRPNIRRCCEANVSSWRRDFIGPQKRGTKSQTLKSLTKERCKQLGFPMVASDDEADAIGILTYAIGLEGLEAPWLKAVEAPLFADKPNG